VRTTRLGTRLKYSAYVDEVGVLDVVEADETGHVVGAVDAARVDGHRVELGHLFALEKGFCIGGGWWFCGFCCYL